MAATTADEVLSLEPEVLTRADDEGIESALNWLQAQPGYTTSRNRWLMRLLMARVSEQYGKMKWRCICWRNSTAAPGK